MPRNPNEIVQCTLMNSALKKCIVKTTSVVVLGDEFIFGNTQFTENEIFIYLKEYGSVLSETTESRPHN
jgi:hypothetical protein